MGRTRRAVIKCNINCSCQSTGISSRKGWENFTDSVIRLLSEKRSGIVFLLWGKYAQAKEILIDTTKHFILKAPHPSPFSANNGFFGCKHFSKTNEILMREGRTTIDWSLDKSNEFDK